MYKLEVIADKLNIRNTPFADPSNSNWVGNLDKGSVFTPVRIVEGIEYESDKNWYADDMGTGSKFVTASQVKIVVANENWKACVMWNNNSNKPIVSFKATWTVPCPPKNNDQTIFIFLGIQSPTHILQPVLQWGYPSEGGDGFWGICSMYAAGQSQESKQSKKVVKINSGQNISAYIKCSPQNNSSFNYTCGFEGHEDDTSVTIKNVPEMKVLCATLEAYDISSITDYPRNTPKTTIKIVEVNNTLGGVNPDWDIPKTSAKLNEHAVVAPSQGAFPSIDLFY